MRPLDRSPDDHLLAVLERPREVDRREVHATQRPAGRGDGIDHARPLRQAYDSGISTTTSDGCAVELGCEVRDDVAEVAGSRGTAEAAVRGTGVACARHT